MKNREEKMRQYRDLIQKASNDPAFRTRLVKHPREVLKQEGWEIPDGLEVRVVENTDTLMHLTLPASSGLTDEELDKVAGGVSIVSKVSRVSKVSKISLAR